MSANDTVPEISVLSPAKNLAGVQRGGKVVIANRQGDFKLAGQGLSGSLLAAWRMGGHLFQVVAAVNLDPLKNTAIADFNLE